MQMNRNPFLLKGYHSPELFCDREQETRQLLRNVLNGVDTTLISPRKYGKTGLIYHFFHHVQTQNLPFEPLYIDIFPSRSLNDFIKILAEAILQRFPEKSSIGSRFLEILKGFRPVITYDPISGTPQVQINYQLSSEKEHTLQGLLKFLNDQEKSVVLAIDEFQQITEYPEDNTEALLRSTIQQLHNIRFIFCGSKHTIMADIFQDAKRPFFSSTKFISLDKIDFERYSQFITYHFEKNQIEVEPEAIQHILKWTKRHTFYTQSLCNTIFSLNPEIVNYDIVNQACNEILENNSATYLQYRELLTNSQWDFLIAVAKEGAVRKLTSAKFLSTYQISGTTTARRNAQSLTDKELLLAIPDKKYTTYQVYDLFLSRWLEREY